MPTISNLTDRPVLLAFNSGRTLRLSPRSQSEEIPDVEISNNAKVAKLAASNVIAVGEGMAKRRVAPAAAAASREQSSSKSTPPSAAAGRTTASDKPAAGKQAADKSGRPAK